jgi:hypothetical protein
MSNKPTASVVVSEDSEVGTSLLAWKRGREYGLLDRSDIRRMEAEGWSFSDGGIAVGDSFAVWAEDGCGNLRLQFLAHPNFYPEAWSDEPQEPRQTGGQLDLF